MNKLIISTIAASVLAAGLFTAAPANAAMPASTGVDCSTNIKVTTTKAAQIAQAKTILATYASKCVFGVSRPGIVGLMLIPSGNRPGAAGYVLFPLLTAKELLAITKPYPQL